MLLSTSSGCRCRTIGRYWQRVFTSRLKVRVEGACSDVASNRKQLAITNNISIQGVPKNGTFWIAGLNPAIVQNALLKDNHIWFKHNQCSNSESTFFGTPCMTYCSPSSNWIIEWSKVWQQKSMMKKNQRKRSVFTIGGVIHLCQTCLTCLAGWQILFNLPERVFSDKWNGAGVARTGLLSWFFWRIAKLFVIQGWKHN